MAEKTDIQTARRNLRSPNIKTRKRALKIIKTSNALLESKTFKIMPLHNLRINLITI